MQETPVQPTETPPAKSWTPRLWWTVVGLVLLDWSYQLLNSASQYWWAAAAAILAGIWGMGTMAYSWTPLTLAPRFRPHGEALAWLTAGVTLIAIGAWAYVYIHTYPQYGTDELAFDQYAAELARHGLNPYVHSMSPAFPMFRVSPGGYTYTLIGQRVTELSYPSLSFLVYVPFLLLGWSSQLAPFLDVIGWALTVVIMFRLLPRSIRPLALVVGSISVYYSLAVIGLTDMIYLPLLMLAAYKWDRFGDGWRSYSGPVLLGLAMAVKQTPWAILPFVLVALACDEYELTGLRGGIKRAARYLAAAAATFLIVNLPYAIASPSAWIHGALTPVLKSLVPSGQGLMAVLLYLHIGGGSLFAFSMLMAIALILMLVLYVSTAPLLRPAIFLMPMIVYFFAVRSYTIYVVALLPAGLIAATSVRSMILPIPGRSGPGPLRSRRWLAPIGVLTAALAAFTIYALTDTAPLSIVVNRTPVVASGYSIPQIYVQVTNRSSAPVSPHFTLQAGTNLTAFWHIAAGPTTLAAGQSAEYTLLSPQADAQPTANAGFTVMAFASDPGSVSVSGRYKPSLWHLGLNPEAIDSLIPVGRKLTVTAQLLNNLDLPVHQAGVQLRMVQPLANTLDGAVGHAAINGGRAGQPGYATTNAAGLAVFRIVGTQSEPAPIAFLAQLVNPQYGYSGGFSDSLNVRFVRR